VLEEGGWLGGGGGGGGRGGNERLNIENFKMIHSFVLCNANLETSIVLVSQLFFFAVMISGSRPLKNLHLPYQ